LKKEIPLESPRILIVEDNTMVAEDCRLCLASLGYAVSDVVATGEAAVEAAASGAPPDAVLMDIRLRGEMDGIEAAERIYARHQIPVVFLSAYSDDQLLKRARQAGSFGYLVKPFEERELYATLEMAIYKAKAERERREKEARLRQAKKLEAIRAMAGGIAHHLNNRLTVVIGNLELAEESSGADPVALTCIGEALGSAKEAAELGRFLLTYLGQRRRTAIPVDLSALIRERVAAHRSREGGNLRWETETPAGGPVIPADPARLAEVLDALLDNAREAVGGGGEGRVRVSAGISNGPNRATNHLFPADWAPAGEPWAFFSVEDNGTGMEEASIHRMFDPFYTDKFLGRGLGLAIVLGIVQTTGGCVAVRSRPGEGSAVTVYLPLGGESQTGG
jgi:signal transduction histidine kinase